MDVNGMMKRDVLTAVVLFLIVVVLGMGFLDRGHEWGDDFAAYMLEARAIANGTMEEQSYINRIIHASELSFGDEVLPESVTYVWGYPLVLSVLFRIFGYDPVSGGMPLVYKLPNLIAYGLFVVVIYLFYRRRFAWKTSLFLALLFGLHADMLAHTNAVMSDIFCLALTMAALWLLEIFLEGKNVGRKKVVGFLLGAVLWYNYEVRLNGVTVIYIVLFAHVLHLFLTRNMRKMWAVQLVPYVTLLLLFGISACVMPQATSNSSHIASGPNSQIIVNLRYYNAEIAAWASRMLPKWMPLRRHANIVLYALVLIGILRKGITQNLHLTALMLGTFVVVFLLPYVQPLRYLFNALPLMLLFAAYGMQGIVRCTMKIWQEKTVLATRWIGIAGALIIVLSMSLDVMKEIGIHVQMGASEYRYEAYGDDALDIYAYIRENTEEEAMIGCSKPRMLTLNTDRIGFMPGINANRYKDMHYLLAFEGVHIYDSVADSIWPELWEELTEVYRNKSFVLYRLSEYYRQTGNTL